MAHSPHGDIRRGDVWWVALDPVFGSEIAKTRPCVVVTHNLVSAHRRTVLIVPLSTTQKGRPPIGVPVVCDGRTGKAAIDQLRAVDKGRLLRRLGSLSLQEMAAVDAALRHVLNL